MKRFSRLITLLLVLSMLVGCLAACGNGDTGSNDNGNGNGNGTSTDGGNNGGGNNSGGDELGEFIDYVASVKLDKNSGRVWTEATVKTFVDGDTTHFYVDSTVTPTGFLKARYLAINTPESTGQIEPWGKAASNFTRSKLENATSIILESDDARWNLDSTGDRYTVWVWYKTAEMTDYRNLNLEIMQEGLAIASSYMDFTYGEACRDILAQAVAHKLHVHDKNTPDPDFYYGAAQPMTLKELKLNIEKYHNTRVSFEGVIVKNSAQTVYVEEYDEETGMYFGIQVYYGFGLDYFGQEILKVGNRVMIVGSVQYYETGGTYQVSDIKYDAFTESEDNIKLISEGHTASYSPVDAETLLNGKVTVTVTETEEDGDEIDVTKSYDHGFLAMHSSASMQNLRIKSLYTTDNGGSHDGAISITCVQTVYDQEKEQYVDVGPDIVVRTEVLLDASGNTITESRFPVGSIISVKGVVGAFDGAYQLMLFSIDDLTFVQKAK